MDIIDKQIFNFNDEHCLQIFPEYEPKKINGLIESSSVQLFKLISYLYNGKNIPEDIDDERMYTLKNLVAEFVIIPILVNLYPVEMTLITDFSKYTPAIVLLNKIIYKYNESVKTIPNINCSFFEFKIYNLNKVFRKLKISNQRKILEITQDINSVLSDNCVALYFLSKHYFDERPFKNYTINTIQYIEFRDFFRDVYWSKIFKFFEGTDVEKYENEIIDHFMKRIIKIYNEKVEKIKF